MTEHVIPPAADVPALIAAAGDTAVHAYREFLETRRTYRSYIARFCRWADARGLALETITVHDVATYAASAAASVAPISLSNYLTPLRGLFRHFIRAGLRSENPCGSSLPDLRQLAGRPAFDTDVKIRPDYSVYIIGIPFDLRRHEADKINRIITAHAQDKDDAHG
jgi:hypothetical protein